MNTPFNVRVYGILEESGEILILKEPFAGEVIYKFPGGGLEFGEGTIECLKREFREELNLEIEVEKHIYTQDHFLRSRLDENEQILMIYYKIKAKNISKLQILDPEIRELVWKPKNEIQRSDLSLPTDQLIVEHYLK